jgi:preprotein translocase subunit YajC
MDPLTIAMFAILAVLVFFMFRNSRNRKKQQEELQAKIVPGVEIMTNFGLFGTLLSIDEFSNVAEVETSPGVVVRVHRQTIAKVVPEVDESEPRSVEEAMERANVEAAERDAVAALETPADETSSDETAPEFGERTEPVAKKPVRRVTKKVAE